MVDYSKWKDIEVSDDEDDTHPNIDTPSLFRWRHEARLQREEEMRQVKNSLEQRKTELQEKKKVFEDQKAKTVGKDIEKLEESIKSMELELTEQEKQMAQKERLTPWNVDTIGHEGFSKTVINTKVKAEEEPQSEEEKASKLKVFINANETLLKQYGLLRKYDDSRRFLLEHPHLACENTASYLVIWCINLALEDKMDLMNHVSHQCIAMQFLLELSKQLETDPRACIGPFFVKIAQVEHTDYKEAFDTELRLFRERIKCRAEQKIYEAEEEERMERISASPGGLDPLEVLESLPEELRKCFDAQDIPLLQEAIAKMPEDQAKYHMKRCIDSGLWIPDGGKKSSPDTAETLDKPTEPTIEEESQR